jgi:transposase-like protein
LQPTGGADSDHVAVNEAVIQLNNERLWLYAAVNHEKHGNRNAVERVFRELKRRTNQFSNCFSHAEADTVEDWLRAFAFAWNQLI